MKHLLLIMVLIVLIAVSCSNSDSILEELRAEDKLENSYEFYPSTLRMLNFENDSSINKLVKDVRKLSLLSMKESTFDLDMMKSYAASLESEEGYDLYFEIDRPESYCYILGNAKEENTLALLSQGNQCYIMDIKGRVDFMQLPQAFQYISKIDSSGNNGYAMLFDLMKSDADITERRRKRREQREAAQIEEVPAVTIDSTLKD